MLVNIKEKLAMIDEMWNPRIAAELNDSYIKLAKLHGEFIWHFHEHEDELFLVIKGTLQIKLRDQVIVIHEGEFAIIPRGTEHCPVAEEEVHLLLVEPKSTTNTGNISNERSRADEWI